MTGRTRRRLEAREQGEVPTVRNAERIEIGSRKQWTRRDGPGLGSAGHVIINTQSC
jgi:hypothetical protein